MQTFYALSGEFPQGQCFGFADFKIGQTGNPALRLGMAQRRDGNSLALRGNTYSQQLVYHRLLRFLGKKVGDGSGNHCADIGQAGEDGFGCEADVFERTECLRQRFGGAFADVTDAEGKKEARKFGRFAGFYACKDVFSPFGRLLFIVFGKQSIAGLAFKVSNLTV